MSTPFRTIVDTYEGRFSDGRTAAGLPATVRLVSQGLEIAPGAGQVPFVWSYRDLAAATPIGRRAGDVLLSCAVTPGATLFVSDQAFVAALADKASHLTTVSQRWRFARPLLAVCALFALAVAALWVADVSPARGLAGLLPMELRRSLGRQVVRSMSQGRGTCDTPEGRAALGRLTERLAVATGGKRFDIRVLNWSLVNAFAAPGEQIVLTRGLIEQAIGPDEVAGVLAHEMGHGLELHPETAIIRVVGLSAAVELMLGGNGGALANIGLVLTQLGYSRAAEREADAHALRILETAHISLQGFAGFFKRVEDRERGSVIGEIGLLRTHPFSAERARLAEQRPAYPATPALTDDDWRALRGICGNQPMHP
ncbi:MAG: M48 family metallopeptidase [Hyphomicrobiaceae bacterium]|nr:M48 family metallopeptidase [Hyphomicrobiaceae bacterium]